jgi:hypothetical protein
LLHRHGRVEWVVCLIVFLLGHKEYIIIRIMLVASACACLFTIIASAYLTCAQHNF